jgi:hypothetical protein
VTLEPDVVEKPVEKPPRWRNLPKGHPKGARFEGRFRQRDLKLAIKAARDAGLENYRIDVDKSGTISVVPLAPVDSTADGKGANEWDEVLKNKPEDRG